MEFEWDPQKSEINARKHGIPFESARNLWMDTERIEIQAPHPIEDRYIVIAKSDNKLWTAIYTYRGSAIRIISVRRARKKEQALYEKA